MKVAYNTAIVFFAALLVLLPAGCSVSDSDYDAVQPPAEVSVGIGNIIAVRPEGAFDIYTDEGELLRVVENLAAGFDIVDGRRVLFSYSVIGRIPNLTGTPQTYEVCVNSFSELISGEPVRRSQVEDSFLEQGLGTDGIYVDRSWFGGEYINIDYKIYSGTGSPHDIRLLWDDTDRGGDDTVRLYLRHNAYGEVPSAVADLTLMSGICSFRISDAVPSEARKAVVTLYWDSYTDDFSSLVTNRSTGTFEPFYPPALPEP